MAKKVRVWNGGPPPSVGWWNASLTRDLTTWRWWTGEQWSLAAFEPADAEIAAKYANGFYGDTSGVEWTTYWPKRARVPLSQSGRAQVSSDD
jgi:hypothetical protein